MVIDSHEHLMRPVQLQLDKMDEAGVDKVILFSTMPHPETAKGLSEIKDEMNTLYKTLNGENSREVNRKKLVNNIEELAERIKNYPDSFYGFGPVPLGLSNKETSEWIQELIVTYQFKGIGEFTPGSEMQIYQLETVFQCMSDYPLYPIWVHTFHPVTLSGLKILMSLCRKYPKIPVIFGHMGGSNWMEVIDFAKENRQIYLDLSAAFASLATKTAIYELPERCLYSSDAPYGEAYLYRQLVEYVSPSQQIADMVLGRNVGRLLKL